MAEPPVDRSTGAPSWRPPIDSARSLELPAGSAAGLPDDARIVAAVLAGDREAYRQLVDREATAVIRACVRVLGSQDEAEDVAQEAFVTAYRSLRTWRADGPFGAWLSRIAIRLALRQLGRRRTLPWTGPPRGAGHDADPTGNAGRDPLAGAAADPERAALRSEEARRVQAAVAALADPYRETVALRFFAERSLDEIATTTGRPLGTVKTHLRRGLLQLRDRLDDGARA